MNYYGPRERRDEHGQPAGLWHYTCRNDDRIWPVGYCAQECAGHATPEEACDHYKAYQLDHELRLDNKLADQQRPCEVCGAWTQGCAQIGGYTTYVLCDEHRTREAVAERYTVREIISS